MEKIVERSAGVILVTLVKPRKFLLLHQMTGNWSFPKGHVEEGENEKEAALRELKEETGISDINFLPINTFTEEYDFKRDDELRHKINTFFFAETDEVPIVMQEKEISEYKWATFEESLQTFLYEDQKQRMLRINDVIEGYDKSFGF